MDDATKSNLFQNFISTPKDLEVANKSDDVQPPSEVESLCVNCGENGITTILLANIPHYREVILSSFSCESCGFKNNDIQSGGALQPRGVIYKVCLFKGILARAPWEIYILAK